MISEISQIPRVDVPTTMTKLFLSYRRDDSADITGRIYDRLESHFGHDHVFRDVDTIPFGLDFRRAIDEAVGKCQVALVVIGAQWVTIKDGKGRQRLTIPNDFVRMEVETALKRSIPVIPVLVGGADMPSADELPPSLAELAYRNGVPVRRDPDFRNDVERLIRGIQHLLKPKEAAPPVVPPPTLPPAPVDRAAAEAEYQRGLDFYEGRRGVTKDYAQAAKAFEKAATSGHAVAPYYLGWLYDSGKGVQQDYAEAMRWYKMAAEQGFAPAQISLGELYANGQGVPKDTAKAIEWFRKAAAQGNQTAKDWLKSLGAT
jgi:hypothetical protein